MSESKSKHIVSDVIKIIKGQAKIIKINHCKGERVLLTVKRNTLNNLILVKRYLKNWEWT